jgi:sodium-independent organic anion transporter
MLQSKLTTGDQKDVVPEHELELNNPDEFSQFAEENQKGSSHHFCFTVQTYILLLSLIYACCSAGTAIIIGTVTTLQKAFHFSSTQIGVIQASYSIGYAGSILFVSHFAERSHKPRWVTAGALAVSLSCLIPMIPHFYIWLPVHRNSLIANLNNGSNTTNPDKWELCRITGEAQVLAECAMSEDGNRVNHDDSQVAYFLFALASVFAGLGNSPLNTVGMTYIDDNVSKQESAFYMGIPMSMFAVGPVLGFFFHAYIMQFDADVFPPSGLDANLMTSTKPNDRRFIGAWWISYLIVGCTILILSLFIGLFPKKLDRKSKNAMREDLEKSNTFVPASEENVDVVVSSNGFFEQILGLFQALAGLLTNSVYLFTLLGSATFSTGMTGLFYFFPKIIEHQFGVSAIVANVCFGIVEIPVGIGMFFGGYFIKRFKFSPLRAALFTPVLQTVGVVTVLVMLFIRCPRQQFVSFEASDSENSLSKGSLGNLSSACNDHCDCDPVFDPVCGSNGFSYLNPCHAGCTQMKKTLNGNPFFSNCSCIMSDNSTAAYGACGTRSEPASNSPSFLPCLSLVSYMIVFLLSMLAFFLTRMTIINVCIRAAGDAQKGLALGLRSFLGNIMGNIASSVLFGVIIDDACVLWRKDFESLQDTEDSCSSAESSLKGSGAGDCLVYASGRFHYLTHGLAGSLDLIAVIFFFIAYFLARKKPWALKQSAKETES